MWRNRKIRVLVGVCVAVVVGGVLFVYNTTDISDYSVQLQLRLLGSSVYEYHDKTGQWPTRLEDLAQTSLPQKSPYWKWELEHEVFVMVWPKGLKPDPKDNADRILAYHNKGLLSQLGQVWVCWGDLRTEYIKTEDLRAKLQATRN
jgi:hypothetical protein